MGTLKYLCRKKTWDMVLKSQSSSCVSNQMSFSVIETIENAHVTLGLNEVGSESVVDHVSGALSVWSYQEPARESEKQEKRRQVGQKRPIDMSSYVAALQKCAEAIKKYGGSK